jgi:hypothetical protein
MRTNILANAVIATSMALLLLVTGISLALAKELQSQTERGAANVSNSPLSERGIDAIGGKEDASSESTSDKVLYKYRYTRDRGKYRVTPGEEVGLNPQPLPPKQLKKNLGEAVGLNPQPLPPKDMGAQIR